MYCDMYTRTYYAVADYFYRPWLMDEKKKKLSKKSRRHENYTTCEPWERAIVITVV